MSHLIGFPGHELLAKKIVRAENCYLYDSEGNRYVDLESGVWCTSVGHANPAVLRAMTKQASMLAHTGFGYASQVTEEAARKILSLLEFDEGRCVFLCSGSEAVEFGVRTAQAIAVRPVMMTMADSYFGAYGAAARRDAGEWFNFDWAPCAGCPQTKACDEHCEHWATIPFDEIGGFLFEPGSSSGLVRFPPEKLIRNIVSAVRARGGLILVNEVTTGLGRTGPWFGFQHYGISPDIVAMGKGIGNGYPVSVTAFAPGLSGRIDGKPLKYAQSHQNDPLGAAIARAVVEAIETGDLIERGQKIGAMLLTGLKAIAGRTDRIEEIRGRGLMVAIELADDAQASFTTRVHRELARRGYLVARRPGLNVLRMDPSLTIPEEEIEGFLATFEELLAGIE